MTMHECNRQTYRMAIPRYALYRASRGKKGLNRSRFSFRIWVWWVPSAPCITWGWTLAQPGEYDSTVHVRQRGGVTSNYFDHLFHVTVNIAHILRAVFSLVHLFTLSLSELNNKYTTY